MCVSSVLYGQFAVLGQENCSVFRFFRSVKGSNCGGLLGVCRDDGSGSYGMGWDVPGRYDTYEIPCL